MKMIMFKTGLICVLLSCVMGCDAQRPSTDVPERHIASSQPPEDVPSTPMLNPFMFAYQSKSNNSLEIITGTTENGEFDYEVDWDNDGVFEETGLTGATPHSYHKRSPYIVSIRGKLPHMLARRRPPHVRDPGKSNLCRMNVLQWGDIQWKSMNSMFKYCRDGALVFPKSDAPDLSQVTDMSHMFHTATGFNQPLNQWDVSHITTMSAMFHKARRFNQPLDKWDVSHVTDMGEMFSVAEDFNQPLNAWNVSQVTDMHWMFAYARAFNQPLNAWNTSSVTDMSHMFYQANSFNQPLNAWNVTNVTNMEDMFSGAKSFNQPLNSWNTKNVITMGGMFNGAKDFNQPLDSWNVSHVTDMGLMFYSASTFNQPLDSWDVSNVTDMNHMFARAKMFNQPLDSWNITNVTNMEGMLDGCSMDTKNYDATLQGWAKQLPMPPRKLGAKGLTYCNASKARQKLIDAGWTIEGDSKKCK